MGEARTVEGGVSSEDSFCLALAGEVSFSVEGYFVEIYVFDKGRSSEICITVEFGGCENTFLNFEVIEGVENWCPGEIEIEFTPNARGGG